MTSARRGFGNLVIPHGLLWTLIGGLVFNPLSAAAEEWVPYRVRKDDTLSGILYRENLRPLYGPRGYLRRVIEKNPGLCGHGNRIYPGSVLRLPAAEGPRDAPVVPAVAETKAPERRIAEASAMSEASDRPESAARSSFRAGLGLEYFRIDGTDSLTGGASTLNSNASPSVFFEWAVDWDENSKIFMRARLKKYSLMGLGGGQTLSNGSGTLTGIAIGVEEGISNRFALIVGGELSQTLFLRAVTTSELAVDSVAIAMPTLGARVDLLKKSNAAISAEGSYAFLLPSKTAAYEIHSGYRTYIGLRLHFRKNAGRDADSAIESRAGFANESQNTSIANRRIQSLVFELSYHWGL